MAIVCDGTNTTGAATTAGATKTFYLVDAAASGSSHASLQDGGVAPTVASTATGWTVGTTAATVYSDMVYASQQGTGTFGAGVLPGATLGTANCARTQNTYLGEFVSGNWTLELALIATAAQSGTVNCRIRVWRSTDPTGLGATEITTSTQALASIANLAVGTAKNGSVTWAAPAFQLNNEYLFFAIALEITVASAGASAGCVFRVGNVAPSISKFTSTAFISTLLPNMNCTICCFARTSATGPPANNFGSIFALLNTLGTVAFSHAIDVLFKDDSAGGGTCSLLLSYTNGSATTQISPTSSILYAQWVFVAITSTAAGSVKCYWKPVGAPQITLGVTQAVTAFVPVQLTVGSDGTGSSGNDFLAGAVAALKIWNNVILTQEELERESEQIQPIRVADLWDWWPFPNDLSLVGATKRQTILIANNTADLSPGSPPPLPLVSIVPAMKQVTP